MGSAGIMRELGGWKSGRGKRGNEESEGGGKERGNIFQNKN